MKDFFLKKHNGYYEFSNNKSIFNINNIEFTICGDIDIYNIEELRNILNNNNFSIKEVLLNLFLRFGLEGYNKIYGEYAFYIYNNKNNELIIVRDPTSKKKIYYYSYKNDLYISNNLKIIIKDKITEVSFNENRMIEDIANLANHSDETYYNEIRFLRKGFYAIFERNKLKSNKKFYTIPSKIIKYKNTYDYFREYEFLMKNAIANRIKGHKNIGLMLSSGADSTALAVSLNDNFKHKNIFSYTHAPKYVASNKFRLTDESEVVKTLLGELDNISGRIIRSENTSVINALYKSLEMHPEPIHASSNLFWIFDIFDNAVNDNVSIILNGQNGNSSISWPTIKYNSLYNINNNGLKKIIKKNIVNTLIYNYYTYFRHTSTHIKLIKEDKILRDYTKQKVITKIKSKEYQLNKAKYRLNLASSEFITPFNTYNNIDYKDPTSDIKLIEFTFNLPIFFLKSYNDRFISQYLKYRGFHNSSKKGLQASDIIKRINDEHLQLSNDKIYNTKTSDKYFNYINKKEINNKTLRYLQKILFLEKY